jgi:hypothetical protein
MPTATARLRQFYARFGEQRFADLVEFLSGDVWYIQLNSGSVADSPRGPQQVGAAYANWGKWFSGMQIGPIDLAAQPESEVLKVGGAEFCFSVVYELEGRYNTPIPGLRLRMPAKGSLVRIRMTDRVWMNGHLQVSRVTNGLQLM